MIFPDILGHEHAQEVLGRLLKSGRIPHALLFHGAEGLGKGSVARLFAASLVCMTPKPTGAGCGVCTACIRAAHGNHPDLLVVTRLPKKDGKAASPDDEPDDDAEDVAPAKSGDLKAFIVVSQVRELNQHAAYAPREAPRRVFIVDPADRMNAESQNALLKTLEEPPGGAVIVLVASRPHVLLPTVRSRCFQVGFGAMSPEDLAARLEAGGMSGDEARARAALSEGRPGRALALDLKALVARRGAILDALVALANSKPAVAELPDFVALLLGETESDLLEGLDLVMALLRDAARSATGSGAILHADVAPPIERLGRSLGAERACEILALVDRLRGDLRLNLNKTLVCETTLAAVAGGPTAALV